MSGILLLPACGMHSIFSCYDYGKYLQVCSLQWVRTFVFLPMVHLQPVWERRSSGEERYYLNENSKEYHHDNSSDEQFLPGKHSRRKQKYKWKTNCSSETSIGDNKLVLKSERYCPEYINDLSQNKNTWGKKTEIQRGGGKKGNLSYTELARDANISLKTLLFASYLLIASSVYIIEEMKHYLAAWDTIILKEKALGT